MSHTTHTESHAELDPRFADTFPKAALPVLRNPQLRKNVGHAIDVIQTKRGRLVAEKTDWQELRTAASAIRNHVLENLGAYLEQFEARCTAAGGQVHWATDADDARRIILDILRQEQATEVIKIKTMTSAEIQLNRAHDHANNSVTQQQAAVNMMTATSFSNALISRST